MSTFQAWVFAFLHGITALLPVDPTFQEKFLGEALGWGALEGPLLGAISLGTVIAILVYYAHDWLSMISSIVQIIAFRRKPMMVDERQPFFILLTGFPVLILAHPITRWFDSHEISLLVTSVLFALFGLGMAALESFSRKTKRILDWNWIDALLMGLMGLVSFIPGAGLGLGFFAAGFVRNYNREAIGKMFILCTLPYFIFEASSHLHGVHLHQGAPAADLSWLSFYVALITSALVSFFVLSGITRSYQKSLPMRGYWIYRFVIGTLGMVYLLWSR